MATTLCDNCQASGLPILPVRYVPVPNAVKLGLPAWASGARVSDVALGSEHHYALRTLRAGFVYLFYSKNARGSNQWECFSVSEDGCLMKQPGAGLAQVAPTQFLCGRQGHSNARLHHLVIEKPEKCGPTWIAFSEHKWSDETLKQYAADAKLRDTRMQTIRPAAMATGSKHSHGAVATEAALNEVIEYSSAFGTDQLPHSAAPGVFSKATGEFDPDRLVRQSTRYPWHQRQGQAADAIRLMKDRAKRTNGTPNAAHVLALWDAIGVAHELNGFRNDAAGWLELYGQERELELTGLNAIEGVKKALEDRASGAQKQAQDERQNNAANWYDPQSMAQRRANALKLPEPKRSQELEACAITEDWARRQVPSLGFLGRLNHYNMFAEPKRSQEIAALKVEVDQFVVRRAKNYKGNIERAIAQSWPIYEEKLDKTVFNGFKTHWGKLQSRADAIIDQRTEALVNWLNAPLFIDTLEDFHQGNLSDGVLFEDAVSDALFGMNSSKPGAKKINEWVVEAKADVRTNLLWRVIALNQKEGIAEVNAALKIAAASSQVNSEAAWGNIGAQVKWNKIADLHKKAISLFNANRKAGVTPVNTRGVDKLLITVGDAIMKPFARVADSLNEKVIQQLLLLRAGVSERAATALVLAQAKLESVSRERLIQRINTTKTFVAAEMTAERAELNKRWAALKATADAPDVKGFSAVKELRLGLVVAVLEGVNLWKISSRVGNDPKIKWQLRAAQMATSAACLDVVATTIKGMHSAKDLAISFQVLKVAGGLLSGGASFIGGTLDFGDMRGAAQGGNYGIAMLYFARGMTQFSGGAITIVVAISYASPLLEKAAVRYAGSAAINVASRMAAWAFAARAGLMLAGVGFSVATLAISVAIWYFSDDALQDWCEESAFGKQPQRKRFGSASAQMKALETALLDVM